jgi:predicted deacetylase
MLSGMGAKYLLRFDDICPTMNWSIWAEIEKILLEIEVKPILAVVPDNQDETLKVDRAVEDFWDRVRIWQARGWTIGLHGYQHRYVTKNSGVVGLLNDSEFAGLSVEEQQHKLQKAVEIFHREGVKPQVWIAPSHSFDATTVSLLKTVGIHIISDGLYIVPHIDSGGTMWIPLQLWRFYPMPFGVWTVCCHHNAWSATDLSDFRQNLYRYKKNITEFNQVLHDYKNCKKQWIDSAVSQLFLTLVRLKFKLQVTTS